MAERPIRCYAHEVRAILAGAQTQLRLVLKPQPYFDTRGLLWWEWAQGTGSASIDPVGRPNDEWLKRCPYGKPGDVLWVRETWAPCEAPIRSGFIQYATDGAIGRRVSTSGGDDFWIRNGHTIGISDPSLLGVWVGKPSKWRPSIHMPRWASRLSLRIKSVRVERLQEISESDTTGVNCFQTAKDAYAALWESINGPGSWEANPFVWVIEIEVMK